MKEFYQTIENFIEKSYAEAQESTPEKAVENAINIHHNIDIFVKKLQILKEYAELLEEETLFFSENKNVLNSVFSIDLFRELQNRILNVELSMYDEKFSNKTKYSSELTEIKFLLNSHIDEMYKIGEKLRETNILKNNLGG